MPSAAKLHRVPLAVLLGLLVHYLCAYTLHTPLWTETIAEWIMARTPSRYAVPLLTTLGAWAKPFALTGGLAMLGFATSIATLIHPLFGAIPAALVLGWAFKYTSILGQLSFWVPAALISIARTRPKLNRRREFLAMLTGFTAVAIEGWLRDREFARHARQPVDLFPFQPPVENFGQGLVRKAVTPIPEFYGMSKNAIDPRSIPQFGASKLASTAAKSDSFRLMSYWPCPEPRDLSPCAASATRCNPI